MSSIGFYGAAGTVTGSNYIVTNDRHSRILIDLGMYQGTQEIVRLNTKPLGYDVRTLSAAFLTHAHLDHCGRLPLLVKNGFRGKIFMTEPTRDMMQVVLMDAARIAQVDDSVPQMYTDDDVMRLLPHIEIVNIDETVRVGGFAVTFKHAGHILGAASLEVKDETSPTARTLIFSGDLGRYPHSMLVSPHMFEQADVVVMESTYGGRMHPDDHPLDILESEVTAIQSTGGVLMIPAFAIQRTQDLLVMLKKLKDTGRIPLNLPVYLDSPMAIKITQTYEKYKNKLSPEFQKSNTHHPFQFHNLHMLVRSRESQVVDTTMGPRIVIAGSGMMHGGRILKHAQKYITHDRNRLLMVGYQGDETLGREIVDGATEIQIFDVTLPVKAHVTRIHSMSAHADEGMLLRWLQAIHGVKKVFLTHGEDHAREAISPKIKDLGIQDVDMPELYDECALI